MSPQLMSRAKRKMIVMHPLPRVFEISPEFDTESTCRLLPASRERRLRSNGSVGDGAQTSPDSLEDAKQPWFLTHHRSAFQCRSNGITRQKIHDRIANYAMIPVQYFIDDQSHNDTRLFKDKNKASRWSTFCRFQCFRTGHYNEIFVQT